MDGRKELKLETPMREQQHRLDLILNGQVVEWESHQTRRLGIVDPQGTRSLWDEEEGCERTYYKGIAIRTKKGFSLVGDHTGTAFGNDKSVRFVRVDQELRLKWLESERRSLARRADWYQNLVDHINGMVGDFTFHKEEV